MASRNFLYAVTSAIVFAIFSGSLLWCLGVEAAPTIATAQQQNDNSVDGAPIIYTRREANSDGIYELKDIPSYLIWLSLMGQQHRARYGSSAVVPTPSPSSSAAADEEEQVLEALSSAVVERQQQQQHQREPTVMRRDVRQGKSAWDVPRGGSNAIFPHIGRRSPEPQASAMSMLLQEMNEARQRQQSGGPMGARSTNMMIMPRIG